MDPPSLLWLWLIVLWLWWAVWSVEEGGSVVFWVAAVVLKAYCYRPRIDSRRALELTVA